MIAKSWRIGFAAVLVCSLLPAVCIAQATEARIGRVTLLWPKASVWQEVTVKDEGQNYTGDSTGTISSETKLFARADAQGVVDAVVRVRGSAAGISDGYMRYSSKCTKEGALFAEGNEGQSLNLSECVKVFRLYATDVALFGEDKALRDLVVAQGWKMPAMLRPIIAHFANSTGTFLTVTVYQAPVSFGVQNTSHFSLPNDLHSIRSITWAKELMKEVKGSVMSIRGRMQFPAFITTSEGGTQLAQ